ncbi:MAG: porin [Planctomycetes bacterium]|nr:porin [Planctomycetota bacterium]
MRARSWTWMTLVASLALCCSAAAQAQDEPPVVIDDGAAVAVESYGCGGGCGVVDTGCDACGSGACGADAKPFKLFDGCFLKQRKIVIGGWLQQGITVNSENPADRFNGPVATNDLDSEYQMNQLWLFADRQADNGGCGWAWGGHIDMMYGTDWRFGINNGLENQINAMDGSTYGIVLPQFYLELAYNKLSVKLGHFAGILDYEAVPAVANPFYSHSYSYGYTVPQLVTGALADYKLTNQLSIQGGFHRGWMQFEDNNNALDFMGGIKWNSCDKRTSLAWGVSSGRQGFPFDDTNRFVYSFVLQREVTKKLKYVLVHNLGQEDWSPAVGAAGQDGAEWYGINQYFLYQLNKKWAANLRVEWLRDDDGARIAGPGNLPGVRAWNSGGFAGNFWGITSGLSWRPCPNVTIRPEARWDWYDGLALGPDAAPFGDGTSKSQFTAAVDLIVTF